MENPGKSGKKFRKILENPGKGLGSCDRRLLTRQAPQRPARCLQVASSEGNIFPNFPGFSQIFQDRVKIVEDLETLPNNWEECWYLKNTMASTPGAKSCLNEGPILHNSTVVLPMPVHVTPRELFKVLLDAFKVGLIKAFKAILKAFFKLFQRSKAFKF